MQSLHFPFIKEFNSFFWNKVKKIHLQALLKSHFALKFKQLNKIFIYQKRNNCQHISSSLLKISVEKFCCLHLQAHTAMLLLYSKIREYDQTTPVLTNLVMCVYAASVINGTCTQTQKKQLQCKGPLLKKMSKIIVPLHVMTECDVTLNFLALAENYVETSPEKY